MFNKNNVKTVVLLAGLAGLLILIGGQFGGRFGATAMFMISLVMVGGSYWFSDKLAIRAAGAVSVSEAEMPEFYAIVRELTQVSGLPMPRLYMTPDAQPNAFATGRNPDHAAVAVTQGLVELCDRDELRGVLAHELSHIAHRDILISSVAAAVATAIMYLATMAQWAAIFGGGRSDDDEGSNPLALLAMAMLAPMAAGLLQMALSRSREFEADRGAARMIGTGEPLVRALQKLESYAKAIPMNIDPAHASAFIVNPLSGRQMNFANLFRTHPTTEERVERLRAYPN